MKNKPEDKSQAKQLRQASLAMMLPTMMAAGPLAGWLISMGLIRLFDIGSPAAGRTQLVCILLGVLAGARETLRLIKKIDKNN